MGAANSYYKKKMDDKLMTTKMDLSHCGCLEVPPIVFNAERCIETLILASNHITSLPPQLFHCQEIKYLNLNDNSLTSIPPAIGTFQNLVSLKLDKNNLQKLPEDLILCRKLKRLSLNNNPWKQMPNIVTQIISLEELYMNDCELSYLPASIGRLAKVKILEFRNNNLCNLPLSMTRLELLTRLDISDNEFKTFPLCISKLEALTELLMDNNDLEEIVYIKNLVHLEHLDASYNHITNVSGMIGCCERLSMLNLSYNYIEQLPFSIGNISHLQTLHLEMNELTKIPVSIGKLLNLEELNLCNNKLYSLPSAIGLLRNLKNLNVSRNMIEEFPPEIGSCTKLSIINAAYNRLQVLPSEIGYLNNLKVLDLVGNFLMYLPITIINLQGVRAIWLSANQNIPLIPFTEDLNLASGERFLTNIALPQLGEIPMKHAKTPDKKIESNDKTTLWNKKIRFAEDENILPRKLHRTPTPFPKELRAPMKKIRDQGSKESENYENIVDGKMTDLEMPPLEVSSICTPGEGSGITFSEGYFTHIREANIRRNTKEIGYDISNSPNDEVYYDYENGNTSCEINRGSPKNSLPTKYHNDGLNLKNPNLPSQLSSPPPASSSSSSSSSTSSFPSKRNQKPELHRTLSNNDNESKFLLSKQDFITRAKQMKNKNISPPCYEIAKMYSTKAALFENRGTDHI